MALIVFITGENSLAVVATFLFGGNSLARTRSTDDSLGSSRNDNSIEQDFESKSHLSDSFLDGQDFTHLFSYHTPSVDSLHTLTNHSTSRKLAVNFNNIPSRLSFDQTTKQCFGTYKIFTASHRPQNCTEYISITYGQGLTRIKIQILFIFGRRLDLLGNI